MTDRAVLSHRILYTNMASHLLTAGLHALALAQQHASLMELQCR